MATSSLEVWDDKQNHSACRVRGNRTTPSQDHRRDRSPGPAATRQPGRAADPLRQHWLPLPRRPAAAARALPDLDPQGRQQDRHPHPGHHPGRRPAPADGELPATTRTHHRTRQPCAPAGQRRPDPARPLTGLSARALRTSATPRGTFMTGSGRRTGGQHQQANHCQSAVIHPSRPRRHGSSCPTGAPTPEVTTAWLVGLGRSPVSVAVGSDEANSPSGRGLRPPVRLHHDDLVGPGTVRTVRTTGDDAAWFRPWPDCEVWPVTTESALYARPLVLVTGATGYIGGRLVPELLAAGFRVRVMAVSY